MLADCPCGARRLAGNNVAPAQEYSAGAIKVSKVWTREMPAGAKVGAGFMTITNTGKEPDTLIGGRLPLPENSRCMRCRWTAA